MAGTYKIRDLADSALSQLSVCFISGVFAQRLPF